MYGRLPLEVDSSHFAPTNHFCLRLLNPHMLTQALLVSLLLERPAQWVEITKYVVTFPLLCLCVLSYLLVYSLQGKD